MTLETDEDAKTYLSFAVAIRFASGFVSGLTSGTWANKFGRRKSLFYCQAFCMIGAVASGSAIFLLEIDTFFSLRLPFLKYRL